MAAGPSGSRSTETVRDGGQLDFFRTLWTRVEKAVAAPATNETDREQLRLAPGSVTVIYVRHPRARRYRLLFRRDGTARCTIPRRGTLAEAKRFVAENDVWLTERLQKHLASPRGPQPFQPGGKALFGGVELELVLQPAEGETPATGRVGELEFPLDLAAADLRPQVEAAMRNFAAKTLPARALELAGQHGLRERVRRVSVRSQRTRWGSCSRRGVISLNWRLVQIPPEVSDYIILHELAHLRQMNHSPRFWTEVKSLCPGYEAAEAWLKQHGRLVL